MMLIVAEIREGLTAPDFGPVYRTHMEEKHHEGHRRDSVCAWRLLAEGLRRMGYENMPEVVFLEGGKPVFRKEKLHFSLSHSGRLAAAVISEENCAVDVEIIDSKMEEKLRMRCMHENESAAGMDFFECWTKKECLGKLNGKGMPSQPCKIDLTKEKTGFFSEVLSDSGHKKYRISAAGFQGKIEWIEL